MRSSGREGATPQAVGRLFAILLALLVSGCLPDETETPSASASPSPQATGHGLWRIALELDVPHDVRVAAFLDAGLGITGGPSGLGRARFTSDGGESWTESDSGEDCLFGLDIVDSVVAWQCSLGPVGVSADGGRSWQAVTEFGNSCRQLSFVDGTTGWIASRGRLGVTKNGGYTWEELSLPDGADDIAAIWLRNAADGYVLDTSGVLFTTEDGGARWSSQPADLGLAGGRMPNHDTASAAIRFFDAENGIIVAQIFGGPNQGIATLRTTDGGETWTREALMESPLLISLYLSHDGSTLTIADRGEDRIQVLRYEGLEG